jgi:hypothetical protein
MPRIGFAQIFGMRTEVEMGRIAAGGVVALVEEQFAAGNRPVGQFPGKTMCEYMSLPSSSSGENAVAISISSPSERPTFGLGATLNLVPQPFGNHGSLAFVCAGFATEASPFTQFVGPHEERIPADRAGGGDLRLTAHA